MDKYYVYRPLLDLIGFTEGTDKGRGYNETLGYGKMLDGKVTKDSVKTVDLVSLTLSEIDALQTRMLADPDNKKMKSSAVGRYQVIRTTLRGIREEFPDRFPPNRLYDVECQDEIACYLLGIRGVDKYLAGRLNEDTFINNLAKEWASLPTITGAGNYEGQRTPIKVTKMRETLAEVRRRHGEGQPKTEVKVLPPKVEKEIRQKTNWGAYGSTAISILAGFGSWLAKADTQLIIVLIGGGLVMATVILFGGEWIIRRIKKIREALENEPAA